MLPFNNQEFTAYLQSLGQYRPQGLQQFSSLAQQPNALNQGALLGSRYEQGRVFGDTRDMRGNNQPLINTMQRQPTLDLNATAQQQPQATGLNALSSLTTGAQVAQQPQQAQPTQGSRFTPYAQSWERY